MSSVATKELRPLRDLDGPAQITGDAVVLDIPAAGLPQRCLAGAIDGLCAIATFFALTWLITSALGADDLSSAAKAGWAVLTFAAAFVLMPAIVETASMGRSLGKLIFSLRVVRSDGGAIAFRHALVRALVGVVEIWSSFGLIAFFTAALSQRSRRLGDLAAGTYVVRESRKLTLAPPPQMPPPLAAWANVAMLSPMPAPVAAQVTATVRGHVGLSTPAYLAVVQQALSAALPYVTPPPPPGHDPAAVLLAIAVLRRDADLRRIERDERARASFLR